MSDQQKIWFIYLTDHHEGPFTADEVAQKAKAGVVSGASLAWKDGMPEWVAAETIPELQEAMNPPAAAGSGLVLTSGNSKFINTTVPQAASPMEAIAANAQAAPAAPEGKAEGSLAMLLAASQGAKSEGATNPSIASSGTKSAITATGTKSGLISDSASVLSSMANQVQAQNPHTMGSGVSLGGGTAAPSALAGEPMPEDEVWTLKIGAQVSGLYSLNKLMEMVATTGVPEDAMLWHPGWSDFESIAVVPQLEVARKARGTRASGTKSSMARPGVAVSAMSNAAEAGDDEEPTDTGIIAPPPGWKGKVAQFTSLAKDLTKKITKVVQKRKADAAAKSAATAVKGGKKIAVAVAPVGKKAAAGKGGGLKRMLILLGGVLVLAGAGAGAWFFLLRSPIPSDLDVTEEDREAMLAVVKAKEGHKLYLAQAKGTEDNPADPTNPKYYVASNLPEGAAISLQVTGVSGTLVNRISFEKSFSANVEKTHLAVFDQVKENGKPLWGEFAFKATSEGAEPMEVKGKFIGSKGAAYTNRLKTFKDSVQAEYDAEVGELREYISTLKNLQAEASKQIADYKTGWVVAGNRTKITADWALLRTNSQTLLNQLQQKLKDRMGGTNQPKYHLRAFQDVSTTVGQLDQLVKLHGERLSGAPPGIGNPDELDGFVQAGVQALEQWLAQAVAKNPFDPSMHNTVDPTKPSPAPPPQAAPAPAPATPAAAATALPAAAPAPAPAATKSP